MISLYDTFVNYSAKNLYIQLRIYYTYPRRCFVMDEIKKDQLSLALIKRELTKIYTWQLLYLFIIIPALGYLLWLPSLLFFNTAFYPIYIRIVIFLLILLFISLSHVTIEIPFKFWYQTDHRSCRSGQSL